MIKLALVGYGKMGKMIESIAPKDQFAISGTYDVINPVKEHLKNGSDVAIEFSTPASVIENIEFLSSRGIDVVCGTTGWYNKADIVKDIIRKNGTGFIYASNFSVGVNIFFNIVKNASNLMSNYPQYNTGIKETHHTQKLDKPSGTAIRIAEYLLEGLRSKTSFVNDSDNPETNEINIVSERLTDVVGRHEVDFESEADTISLIHNAKSRRGFAEGALLAAKFIKGKKGFYKFEDIFCDLKI
ncbi:MAG TPA: 4-hydroxy-tetrahydrodipicolinate reductase [Ignavibacteria bacterium]|nr:4-hydroxy-tetrahydrodipicolinate reductase [Ignavibacteria bacterium]HMQ97693.1 4-hydroxy-tetrahydrodipicolinate reductase [Ignavibacteria bacterium]